MRCDIDFFFLNQENSCAVQIESSSEVTDPRLGLPNPSATCLTCGATNMKYCEGMDVTFYMELSLFAEDNLKCVIYLFIFSFFL